MLTARLWALLILCAIIGGYLTAQVSVSFNNSGLSTLSYSWTNVLAYGDLRVPKVVFRDQYGNLLNGSLNSTLQFNPSSYQLKRQFSWGVVSSTYVPRGSSLDLDLTITNTSPWTLQAFTVEPLGLHLPNKPSEYHGTNPMLATNIGEPSVVRLTYGANSVVLTNRDVLQPLLIGFPWSFDPPANQTFPLRVHSDRDSMYPTNLPTIVRPIAPGATDTYRLSLRFGLSLSSTQSFVNDIYNSFREKFPETVAWKDRRVIGSLIMASAAQGWAKNPRGWFNDPSIDVTTPAGIARFEAQALSWADGAVAELRRLNAQGGIVWDIEGEQYPHATTYIGDPRLQPQLAPELNRIVDQFFAKFRDAGLRTGVCIRPQQLVVANGQASQQTVEDPTQLLLAKIAYAKNRWGATLFYVDSNGDPNLPIDPSVFRRIQSAHPDILLIPEHETTGYYGFSAPYQELRQNIASTPASVRNIYPNAFSVINVQDGPIQSRFNELVTAVQRGDILMTRGWWPDPANNLVLGIYGQKRERN